MIKENRIFYSLILISVFLCQCQNSPIKSSSVENTPPEKIIARMVLERSHLLPNKTIAIIEFSDIDGKPAVAGKILAERITTEIAQYKKLKIVERNLVSKILDEQKLSAAGLTESRNTKKIGGFLNADAILTGTVSQIDGHYEIHARLISAQEGEILGSSTAFMPIGLNSSSAQNGKQLSAAAETEENENTGLKTPRIEVIQISLKKIKEGLNENYGTIRITGKARFIPSPEKPKAFKELLSIATIELLDEKGRKVMNFGGVIDGGEYGNPGNVVPDELFPFKGEDMLVKKELWEKISSLRFIKWEFLK